MPSFTETFTTAGTYQWMAPKNCSSVTVKLWGGGGTGGPATGTASRGGGGAGGQYAEKVDSTISPGTLYALVVAAASTAATSAVVNGNDSTWRSTVAVAKGGAGGANATGKSSSGGTGSTTGGVGDTVYAGGNGAAGTASGVSGGGGGGAGSTGAGGNASSGTAGTGTSNSGGNGGAGVSTANTRNAGSQAGGGGSGGLSNSSTDRAGGNGGAGRAELSYTADANAISLNGSTQYGKILNQTNFNSMNDWMVEAWFKRSSGVASYDQYFSLSNATDDQWGLASESGSPSAGFNFNQKYSGSNNADGYIADGDAPMPLEQWTHVAVRHDATLKITTVLINGVPWENYPGGFPQVGNGSIMHLTDGDFYIGAHGYDSSNRFTGSVGGFIRIWNRWVPNSEVLDNLLKTLDASQETGLIVNINFTEGSGTSLDNTVSGGNDMTLFGTPSWVAGPGTADKVYTNPKVFAQSKQSSPGTASTDDAEEGTTSGDTVVDSSDTELTLDGATRQLVGLRFTGISVPNAATISHAYLRGISEGTWSSGTDDVVIKGEAADNPSTFSAGSANHNISGRSTTTASVNWGISSQVWRTVQKSPDLASIVQEIVNRGGWSSGNAMVFIITGTDTDIRNFFSNDRFPYDLGWSLEIEYVSGGGSSQIKKVVSIPLASIKKVSGVAIASVKKVSSIANS